MDPICSHNTPKPSTFLQLPGELLELIIAATYHNGRERSSSVIAISCTCKSLREICMSLMFGTRHIQLHKGYVDEPSRRFLRMVLDPKSNAVHHILQLNISDLEEGIHSENNAVHKAPEGCTSDVLRSDSTELVRKALNAMTKLQTIRFDPYGIYFSEFLEELKHRSVHIVLDQRLRHYSSYFDANFFSTTRFFDCTWSLAVHNGKVYGEWVNEVSSAMRVRALEWSHPLGVRDTSHVKILEALKHCLYLEELQVSEKALHMQEEVPFSSYALQICAFIASLPSLKRLSVEGSELTTKILPILPQMQKLEDLRIYSPYRAAFHPDCPDQDGPSIPTIDMPWLQLPNLKMLDLRFVCRHFTVQQLVPNGLRALRIEFFGANDRLSGDELRWLAEVCPNLDRLEVDIGDLNDIYIPAPELNIRWGNLSSKATILFRALFDFPHLHTLRLFPSYWQDGTMSPAPFKSSFQLAYMFRAIQKNNPHFRALLVCIAYGEYPFDLIPRMVEHSRPWKYTLSDVGDGNLLLRTGFAAKAEIHEMLYTANNGIVTKGNQLVQPRTFIEDLTTGWVLPHYDLTNEEADSGR